MAVKSIFHKLHQKGKAYWSRYDTDNPTAPQLEWETRAHRIWWHAQKRVRSGQVCEWVVVGYM